MPKLIFCTTSDIKESRKISKELLNKKLVACVNILPSIESMYRWKGKIESDEESVLFIKTVDHRVKDTIDHIKKIHSYDVPEIIVIDLVDGLPDYFDFLQKETL